jgi:predicted nucleic acid-binding protein
VTVCVDASLVIHWLVPQQLEPMACQLMDGWIEDGDEIIGPALLFSEVVSVLRRQVHLGVLDEEDADRMVWLVLRLGIRRIDNMMLYRRAYEIATRHGHPRAYDAHYVAAAEHEGVQLWTADRPLYQSLRNDLPIVRHVSKKP